MESDVGLQRAILASIQSSSSSSSSSSSGARAHARGGGIAQWAIPTSGNGARKASTQSERPPWGGRPSSKSQATKRQQQPKPVSEHVAYRGERISASSSGSHRHPIYDAIEEAQSATYHNQPQARHQRQPRQASIGAKSVRPPSSIWQPGDGASFSCANDVCCLDGTVTPAAAIATLRDDDGTVRSGRFAFEVDVKCAHAPQGSGRAACITIAIGLSEYSIGAESTLKSPTPLMVCITADCSAREWTLEVREAAGLDSSGRDATTLATVSDVDLRPNSWRHVAVEVRGNSISLVSSSSVIFEQVSLPRQVAGPLRMLAPNRAKQLWKNVKAEMAPENETELSFLMHSICNIDGASKSNPSRAQLVGEDPALIEMIERDIISELPRVSFDDIASLDDAKKVLDEAVRLPLIIPDFFTGIREPWQGVLLFGPPGTGKTLLAKAVASMGGITFFNCGSSTLTSKYRGESEKLVRCLFRVARHHAPSIIFFDEVDALVSSREADAEHEASRRFKSELLSQMDGITSSSPSGVRARGGDGSDGEAVHREECKSVMVLATTNSPWTLDDAMRRRLEKRIYVPLPDLASRRAMFDIHLSGVHVSKDVDLETLAVSTEGFSGADIKTVCRDASLMPMRRLVLNKSTAEIREMKRTGALDNASITSADFEAALAKTSASVAAVDIERFERWNKEFANT